MKAVHMAERYVDRGLWLGKQPEMNTQETVTVETPEQLLRLVRDSLEDTVLQRVTTSYAHAQALETSSKAGAGHHIQEIKIDQLAINKMMRGVMAVLDGGVGKIWPARVYPNKTFIDLEKI